MKKPNFSLMWTQYPDHIRYPTLSSLFTHIGGQLANNINVPGFGPNGNTCATRMSYALNYGGAPVDRAVAIRLGLNTLKGDDGKFYLFRVRELKSYLAQVLGSASKDLTPPFGDTFASKSGIVAMDVIPFPHQ